MPSEDNPTRKHVTGRLNLEERHTLIIPAFSTLDPRVIEREVVYYPVPSNYRTIANPPVWRILLKFKTPSVVVGLDIYADVIMGRGSSESESLDIDLTNLDAVKTGISRRHAMFRPTPNKLYLIDLQSTNGTFVNAIQLSRGMAHTVRTGDMVSLAGLSFSTDIIFSPTSLQGMNIIPEGQESKEEALPTLKIERPKSGQDTLPGTLKHSGAKPGDEDTQDLKAGGIPI